MSSHEFNGTGTAFSWRWPSSVARTQLTEMKRIIGLQGHFNDSESDARHSLYQLDDLDGFRWLIYVDFKPILSLWLAPLSHSSSFDLCAGVDNISDWSILPPTPNASLTGLWNVGKDWGHCTTLTDWRASMIMSGGRRH